MKTRTSIRGGGIATRNHNESIRVRSNVKAGGITIKNHNESIRVGSNPKGNNRRNRKDGNMYGIKAMSVHIIYKSRSQR
jgi:hypothetical protein